MKNITPNTYGMLAKGTKLTTVMGKTKVTSQPHLVRVNEVLEKAVTLELHGHFFYLLTADLKNLKAV